MKIRVKYTEVVRHVFEIKAEDGDEVTVNDAFYGLVNDGKIDFSYGEVIDGEITDIEILEG